MFDDGILTIEEVARYLRVSERTVYEWAQKGEIPAGKIGTVWRFRKSDISRWLDERLSSGRHGGQSAGVQASAILSPSRVLFMKLRSKREALLELAANLATAPQVKNGQELACEIIKREELMSTAIGKGIAIPHVRLQSVTDLVVSVGISSVNIDGFNPLDDEPVRFVLMIAAAYNQHASYLRALAFFSSALKNRNLRKSLLKSKTENEVYGLLSELPSGHVVGQNP